MIFLWFAVVSLYAAGAVMASFVLYAATKAGHLPAGVEGPKRAAVVVWPILAVWMIAAYVEGYWGAWDEDRKVDV